MTKNRKKHLTSSSTQMRNAIERKKKGEKKRVAGQTRFDEDFLNEINTTNKGQEG